MPRPSSTQVPDHEASATGGVTAGVPPGVAARVPWWARKWPQRAMYAGVTVVLALGFMSYQSPDMRVNWEAIAALCGF